MSLLVYPEFREYPLFHYRGFMLQYLNQFFKEGDLFSIALLISG
jgi:hypothetical protein